MTAENMSPEGLRTQLENTLEAVAKVAPYTAAHRQLWTVVVILARKLDERDIALKGLRTLYDLGQTDDAVSWSWVTMTLSELCYESQQFEEARRLLSVAMSVTRGSADCRPLLPKRLSLCAQRAMSAGSHGEAHELWREAYAVALDLWGPTDVRVARRMTGLGRLAATRKEPLESVGWFEGAIAALDGVSEHQALIRETANLLVVQLLILTSMEKRAGRLLDAVAYAQRGMVVCEPHLGADHTLIRQLRGHLR